MFNRKKKIKDEEAQQLHAQADNVATDEQLAKEAVEAEERAKTIAAIKKFTDDDDEDLGDLSLRTIIGGDILQSKFFLKQITFFMFVVLLMIVYTANRYQSQQDIITIDSLKTTLESEHYNVLTQSSVLLNITRQSNIEKKLKEYGDTALVNPTTPPYLINKEDNE